MRGGWSLKNRALMTGVGKSRMGGRGMRLWELVLVLFLVNKQRMELLRFKETVNLKNRVGYIQVVKSVL